MSDFKSGELAAEAGTTFLTQGMTSGKSLDVPLTQQRFADTLGLSLVHTNKTLRVLYNQELISWKKKTLKILDHARLCEVAAWEGLGNRSVPLSDTEYRNQIS